MRKSEGELFAKVELSVYKVISAGFDRGAEFLPNFCFILDSASPRKGS